MILNTVKSLSFRHHLLVSVALRLAILVYGEFHDQHSEVPFTDVDYKVVTDGSRHVIEDGSPFQRHTYRYTPLLAYFLVPNILVHRSFGKILFCLFDLLIGILIRKIISDEFQQTFRENAINIQKRMQRFERVVVTLPSKYEQIATWSSLVWLYNPMSMVIATRGNGDAITSFFVLLTMYAIQKALSLNGTASYLYVLYAGIAHGIAIHFRLYPLAFSLAFFIQIGYNSSEKGKNLWKSVLQPNLKQILLVISTLGSLFGLTLVFYRKYGYEFLYEAYIFHLVRKDTRHNFSLYFYMNYLNAEPFFVEKILTFLPQLILLILISLQFGRHRKTLAFAVFLQSFVMVTFNPVVTSQYFVWFLSILPICLKNLKGLGLRRSIAYAILWTGVQCFWLFSAYLLEFKGWNTFGFIWMTGAIFFAINCFILKGIITSFDVIARIV